LGFRFLRRRHLQLSRRNLHRQRLPQLYRRLL